MWVGVVTLFPEMFAAISTFGITRRAVERDLLGLEFWNPRDFATDRHNTVDDKPFGGGPGMLMKVPPLREAIHAARREAGARGFDDTKVIYLSPQGQPLDQSMMVELASRQSLICVAGRYEGVDERVIRQDIDLEVSIGDYVLSGGELPAMVLIDGVARLIPGVVGDPESVVTESFSTGLLDYPQYTRPDDIDGEPVPDVLLSGDHEKIRRWRQQQAVIRTYERRPDLLQAMLEKDGLDDELKQLLDEYLSDQQKP